jgi:TIR domain
MLTAIMKSLVRDVFVSYKHGDDTAVACELTRRLRAAGFSVFIDEDIPAGAVLATVIHEAVTGAKAVVVLWSASVKAEPVYVMGELAEAKERGTLVPVALDETPVHVFFKALKVRRLAHDGVIDEREFQALRRDLGHMCGRQPAEVTNAPLRALPAAAAVASRRVTTQRNPTLAVSVPQPCGSPVSIAVARAISAVDRPGVWAADSAPVDLQILAKNFAGADTADAVGLVDLSLPGTARTIMILARNGLSVISPPPRGAVDITYEQLRSGPIALRHAGYGFEAVVQIGEKEVQVRGRAQTDLMLDLLHVLREELIWCL